MISDDLLALRASAVLVLAAERGLIIELACAMPQCYCPDGRFSFEKCKGRRSKWAPSADHYPVPARDGGPLSPENVRLAHWRCNNLEGTRVGGLAASASRIASGQYQSDEHLAVVARAGRIGGPLGGSIGSLSRSPAKLKSCSENFRKASCQRWQINRGKACVCGVH